MKIEQQKGEHLLIVRPLVEAVAIQAIKQRNHPEWSSQKCGHRVAA